VGFDFIQPPRVDCEYSRDDGNLLVKIASFESEAFAAKPTSKSIADLAMVLVDYSYDDEVFCLDSVHFTDDLARSGWRFAIPKEAVGERVMIVYVDVSGTSSEN
jgi:hypothetical protein